MPSTYTVLFVTRNKDNKHVDNFKESRKSFLSDKSVNELMSEFNDFCEQHPYQTCRFYRSVNSRDDAKVKKSLMHYLLDNDCPTWKLPHVVTRLANRPENRKSKHFLVDVDFKMTKEQQFEMMEDLTAVANVLSVKETPNGMHFVTESGFYYKPLVEKWSAFGKVEMKNDDMLLVEYRQQ